MKYSLSARILETPELTKNLKSGFKPDFAEFAELAADCGFDGVNLRPWQINPDTVSDSEIVSMKNILKQKNLEIFVVTGTVNQKFIDRAELLQAKVIQAMPVAENLAFISKDMRMAAQMHTCSAFETIKSSLDAFAGEFRDPRAGVFPEPANLQLAGEKFSEDMFMPLKDRIFGWFFQSTMLDPEAPAVILPDGRQVSSRRVEVWNNPQLDMGLFARAIKKCGSGDFFNINEPPWSTLRPDDFLNRTLSFIKKCITI